MNIFLEVLFEIIFLAKELFFLSKDGERLEFLERLRGRIPLQGGQQEEATWHLTIIAIIIIIIIFTIPDPPPPLLRYQLLQFCTTCVQY